MQFHLKKAGFAHVLEFLENNKNKTLKSILDEVFSIEHQSSEAFKKILLDNALHFFDDTQNKKIRKGIKAYTDSTSTLLCANHAGFENHPMLIASTLLTSLYFADKGIHAIPYSSCASLTPSNATAPTSVFTGGRLEQSHRRRLFRFTPVSANQKMLGPIADFTQKDYSNIKSRINEIEDKVFSSSLKSIVQSIETISLNSKNEDHNLIHTLHRFNTLNYRHFASSFADINPVFFDQERLICDLLIHDLDNENSFISKLITSKENLLRLTYALSDRANTWSYTLCDINADPNSEAIQKCRGTILFHIFDKGVLKPLKLNYKNQEMFLTFGNRDFKLDRESLKQYLKDKLFIPNLYICFATLYFEHKVRPCGGIFMTQYLKDMLEMTAGIMGFKLHDVFFMKNIISACIMPFIVHSQDGLNRPLLITDMVDKIADGSFLSSVLDMKISNFMDITLAEMVYDFCSKDDVNQLTDQLVYIQKSTAHNI